MCTIDGPQKPLNVSHKFVRYVNVIMVSPTSIVAVAGIKNHSTEVV